MIAVHRGYGSTTAAPTGSGHDPRRAVGDGRVRVAGPEAPGRRRGCVARSGSGASSCCSTPATRCCTGCSAGAAAEHMSRWRPAAAEPVRVRVALEMWRLDDVVIDVRTADEYRHGHVSGALNVPPTGCSTSWTTCRRARSSSPVPRPPLVEGGAHGGGGRDARRSGSTAASRRGRPRGLPVTHGDDVGVRDERPRRWWRRGADAEENRWRAGVERMADQSST